MTRIICPNCGHEIDPEQRVIHLRREYYFAMNLEMLRRAAAADQRDNGKVTTRSMASRVPISETHLKRGLNILEKLGELERIGKRSGWVVLESGRNGRYAS